MATLGIYIYLYRNKTFDVFVMILCVLDLIMPGGDIQAEKMGVQLIPFYFLSYSI